MLYHYTAADKTGKIIEADIDAESVNQVLQHLSGRELRPVNVRSVGGKERSFHGIFGGVSTADKVFLTRYLSLMLRVGTDLLSAINILIADFDKPAVKSILLEIRDNLSKGRPFYETFSRYPKYFSPVFINLVKAAEASGSLQKTFDDLSTSLQREVELKNRIQSAFIYPIILVVVALAVVFFLVSFAIPKIAKVFQDSGIDPPVFSQVVFGIGLFMNDHSLALALALAVVVVGGWFFFGRSNIGRRLLARSIRHIPVVSGLYREIAIQQFATTFSALMRAGLPIIQTTKITAEVVNAQEFSDSLRRVADEVLGK